MWLLKNLSKNKTHEKINDKGEVINLGASGINIKATQNYADVPVVAPFGIAYKPPENEEIIIMPLHNSCVSIGSVCDTSNLESGEIKLFSKGGASLILKNDGRILANGIDITERSF